jgi:spermidine/putrescine transport system substrate-binding protein
MSDNHDQLNILAPAETKPKLDALHRAVERAAGHPMSRRSALGLGGLLLLSACGSTSTGQANTGGGTATDGADALAGKPKETYYSSNDELLAKLNAGGTTYDIIAPSQNAVAQLIQENKLMKLDTALLPNLKNLDPTFVKASYDPTGEYHVIKDYGITMFFYNNKIITEKPQTMLDFYKLLPKYVSKGRTNLLDGAEEVVPLALMALGMDPNTDDKADLSKVTDFLMSIRKGVTTITSSSYIDDAIAGKIILSQGWNGDVRRIVQGRQKEGDITAVLPHGMSEIWADNWCIPTTAPDPVAAHAWINWLLTPSTAVTEMEYHNYNIPIASALSQLPSSLKNDPLFNVPKSYTDNYKYILNVSPAVVQERTKIYTQFRAG